MYRYNTIQADRNHAFTFGDVFPLQIRSSQSDSQELIPVLSSCRVSMIFTFGWARLSPLSEPPFDISDALRPKALSTPFDIWLSAAFLKDGGRKDGARTLFSNSSSEEMNDMDLQPGAFSPGRKSLEVLPLFLAMENEALNDLEVVALVPCPLTLLLPWV